MTEQFTDRGDYIVYERTMSLGATEQVTVEVLLTKDYIRTTDPAIAKRYLEAAVNAILTKNGISDAGKEATNAEQGL